jgi:hypothetical protein
MSRLTAIVLPSEQGGPVQWISPFFSSTAGGRRVRHHFSRRLDRHHQGAAPPARGEAGI